VVWLMLHGLRSVVQGFNMTTEMIAERVVVIDHREYSCIDQYYSNKSISLPHSPSRPPHSRRSMPTHQRITHGSIALNSTTRVVVWRTLGLSEARGIERLIGRWRLSRQRRRRTPLSDAAAALGLRRGLIMHRLSRFRVVARIGEFGDGFRWQWVVGRWLVRENGLR